MVGCEQCVKKMNVDGVIISSTQITEREYISLTDMVKNIETDLALIEKWLRNFID